MRSHFRCAILAERLQIRWGADTHHSHKHDSRVSVQRLNHNRAPHIKSHAMSKVYIACLRHCFRMIADCTGRKPSSFMWISWFLLQERVDRMVHFYSNRIPSKPKSASSVLCVVVAERLHLAHCCRHLPFTRTWLVLVHFVAATSARCACDARKRISIVP